MRLRVSMFLLIAVLIPPAAVAQSAVTEADAGAFEVDFTTTIGAPADTVWNALLQVGQWWHPDHSFWGDATTMTIEPAPGGCFCEAGPEGAGAVHMTVLNVLPGQWLRLAGGLGPLQEYAVSGAMTITLAGTEGGTDVQLVYRVAGRVEGGLEGWSGPVAGVLSEAMSRLKSYVETGSPETGG